MTGPNKANDRQVAGDHYKTDGLQHWDMVQMFELDYFQGQITKYLFRWRKKNGIEDLQKALHYLEKYIELNAPKNHVEDADAQSQAEHAASLSDGEDHCPRCGSSNRTLSKLDVKGRQHDMCASCGHVFKIIAPPERSS